MLIQGSKAWPEEAVAGLDPVSRPGWCWVPLGTLFLPGPGTSGPHFYDTELYLQAEAAN